MFKLFRGGIHPADGKTLAREAAIETMPAPDVVTIPLSQHIRVVQNLLLPQMSTMYIPAPEPLCFLNRSGRSPYHYPH